MNTILGTEISLGSVEPSLSVFVSNYNHARFLSEALNALLEQSVRPGKIYVVDDASTDDSRDVIRSFVRTYPNTIEATFLDRNQGFVTNFNSWLANDTSEFVFIAAADDKVAPGLFEKSLAVLRRYPDAGLCSSSSRLIDEQGCDKGRFRTLWPLPEPGLVPPERVRVLLMSHDGWFMGNTTVYRGSALRAVGFDVDLGAFADGLACRVVALRHGACFIPEDLGSWRRMDSGMAMQSTTSPATVHSVILRATKLMTGRFANDFPVGYAQRWRRRWLFSAVSSVYAQSASGSRASIQELVAPLAYFDRIALQAFACLPARLARLVTFLWLRPFDISSAVFRVLQSRST